MHFLSDVTLNKASADQSKSLALMMVSVFMLSACVSNPVSITPIQRPGFSKIPKQNMKLQASVGDTVYEESNYVERIIAKVIMPVQVRFMVTGTIQDEKLVLSNVNGRQLYCGSALFSDSRIQSICLIDKDNNQYFEAIQWVNTAGDGEETLKQPVHYTIDEEMISGYKQELLYQGRTANSVNMQYREYAGNLVRPAFSQTVTYDLDKDASTSASFRGLGITIYEAGNNGISYSVNGQIRKTQ